ncbi:MAG: hypothetical protein HYU66_02620 [Armatimonadetes bacterium]|nr:hypothetical protein [Armatimonadota bacterium]
MICAMRRLWLGGPMCFTAAIVFWLPAIGFHALSGEGFDALAGILLTVACPAVAYAVFKALCGPLPGCSLRTKAAAFLLGIWIWGLPCMMVGATFSGGGFSTRTDPTEFLFMWASFPITTALFATYDGTLFALGGTTLALLVVLIRGASAGTRAAETPM